MLTFSNVQKFYGGFLALDIPALHVPDGLWWVRGENGSGKTTFLKIIAGLLPFTGSIRLNSSLDITKHRKRFVKLVNYAEAEPIYPPFLTAADLVELYCETKGGDIIQVKELLKQLHVYDAYKKQLGTYSSGMVKKVSLALAFIGEPQLILLDEPLITLDIHAISTICRIINDQCQKGVSFVITSHQTLQNDQLRFTGNLFAENRTVSITPNA
jgi:ABC-2 type transport system ATP-binding protein